jgi:hypothetical protein
MQDKKPYNEQGYKHGQWIVRHDTEGHPNYGKLFFIEHYINGVRVGYEENHWSFQKTERIYHAS